MYVLGVETVCCIFLLHNGAVAVFAGPFVWSAGIVGHIVPIYLFFVPVLKRRAALLHSGVGYLYDEGGFPTWCVLLFVVNVSISTQTSVVCLRSTARCTHCCLQQREELGNIYVVFVLYFHGTRDVRVVVVALHDYSQQKNPPVTRTKLMLVRPVNNCVPQHSLPMVHEFLQYDRPIQLPTWYFSKKEVWTDSSRALYHQRFRVLPLASHTHIIVTSPRKNQRKPAHIEK